MNAPEQSEQSASEIRGEIDRLLAEMDEIRARHAERVRELIERSTPGACYREMVKELAQ